MNNKKYWYIQDWGSYKNDTVIFTGYGISEVLRICKKKKELNIFIEKLQKVCFKNFIIYSGGASLLFLEKWENNWAFYSILLHEVHHLIFYILGKNRKMENESEAQAYQVGYLFTKIRQKLFNHFSKMKNKKAKRIRKKKLKKIKKNKNGNNKLLL